MLLALGIKRSLSNNLRKYLLLGMGLLHQSYLSENFLYSSQEGVPSQAYYQSAAFLIAHYTIYAIKENKDQKGFS